MPWLLLHCSLPQKAGRLVDPCVELSVGNKLHSTTIPVSFLLFTLQFAHFEGDLTTLTLALTILTSSLSFLPVWRLLLSLNLASELEPELKLPLALILRLTVYGEQSPQHMSTIPVSLANDFRLSIFDFWLWLLPLWRWLLSLNLSFILGLTVRGEQAPQHLVGHVQLWLRQLWQLTLTVEFENWRLRLSLSVYWIFSLNFLLTARG